MRGELIIAPYPPRDGRDWKCQCARCGSSTLDAICDACGGDGIIDDAEEGEMWGDDTRVCQCETCGGIGGWDVCLSSPEWCQAHPLEGREAIERGQIEWFTAERPEPEEGV